MADPTGPGGGSSGVDPRTAAEIARSMQSIRESAVGTTRAFDEQLRIVTQLRDVMNELSSTMSDAASKSPAGRTAEEWQNSAEAAQRLQKQTQSTTATLKQASTFMESKFAKGLVIGGAAISGLFQGFKNVLALSRAVIGFFASVAEGAFKLGRAIIAIPFRMISGLVGMATSSGGSNELATALEEIRKNFGDLKSSAATTVISVAKNLGKLDLGGISAYRIFGNLADRLKAVNEVANSMGPAFNTFEKEILEDGAAILAFNKGLGITAEQTKFIAFNAMRMGTSIANVELEMTKQAQGMSKAFGINAKVLSRDMAKAMQDLAHFGHLSSKEMAVTAAFANKLGVSVDKLTAIMDKTMTFDQAAEDMSKLNEQFGTNISAQEIMMAQSPGEKLAILQKGFKDAGVNLANLSFQERAFIKQTTAMDDELLNAAMSTKGLATNFKDFQKQGDKNEKKVMSQEEAIKSLAKSMERLTPSGDIGRGGFLQHFFDGLTRGIQTTPEFIQMMYNIRHSLLIVTRLGVQVGKVIANAFPGIQTIIGGFKDLFDPKRYAALSADVMGVIKKFTNKKGEFVGSFDDLMKNLKDVFFNFFDTGKGPGTQILNGFKTFGKTLFKIVMEIGKWVYGKLAGYYDEFMNELKNPGPTTMAIKRTLMTVGDKVANFIRDVFVPVSLSIVKTLLSFLTGTSDVSSILSQNSSGIGKFVGDIMQPIGKELKNAWGWLKGPLKELGKKLAELAWQLIEEAWDAMPWQAHVGLLVAKFGPVFTNVMGATGAWSALGKGLKTIFSRLAGTAVAEAAAASTATATTSAATAASAAATTTAGAAATGIVGGIAAVGGPIIAAIGGGIAGWKIAQHFTEASKEEIKAVGDASEAFEEQLASTLDPSKRLKLLMKEKQRNEQIVEDNTGFFVETFNSMFGHGDEIKRAAQRAIDNAAAIEKKIQSDLEKQQRSLTQGTKEFQERVAAEQAKAAQEAKQRQLDALGPVTIENAVERFKKIDELAKKVMSKDFDIQQKMDMISQKLQSTNFDLKLGPDKEAQINSTLVTLGTVKSVMASIIETGSLATRASQSIQSIVDVMSMSTANVKASGRNEIQKNIKAIQDMVAGVQEMENQMANLGAVKLPQIVMKLKNAVGLGAEGFYSVKVKDVNVNIAFEVHMKAGEVEKILLSRQDSVIRDRLNYAIWKGVASNEPQKNASYIKTTGDNSATMPGKGSGAA